MPLAHARKVALLLGSILSVLLMFAYFLFAQPSSPISWQSFWLYGIGLVAPIAGSVWSQDIIDSGSFDQGAPRYLTGVTIAIFACPLLFLLMGLAQPELPSEKQLNSGVTWALLIGTFGIIIVSPLMKELLRLIGRFLTFSIKYMEEGALQITFALLAPIEIFVCWVMLMPS